MWTLRAATAVPTVSTWICSTAKWSGMCHAVQCERVGHAARPCRIGCRGNEHRPGGHEPLTKPGSGVGALLTVATRWPGATHASLHNGTYRPFALRARRARVPGGNVSCAHVRDGPEDRWCGPLSTRRRHTAPFDSKKTTAPSVTRTHGHSSCGRSGVHGRTRSRAQWSTRRFAVRDERWKGSRVRGQLYARACVDGGACDENKQQPRPAEVVGRHGPWFSKDVAAAVRRDSNARTHVTLLSRATVPLARSPPPPPRYRPTDRIRHRTRRNRRRTSDACGRRRALLVTARRARRVRLFGPDRTRQPADRRRPRTISFPLRCATQHTTARFRSWCPNDLREIRCASHT